MVDTLLGIQIIALSFAGFMLYVAFLHYKKKNISKFELAFWTLIWLTFVFFALFPRTLDPILSELFIARAMDLLMIGAFMILAYLGFSNHVGIKNLQKQIRHLVSSEARKNVKKS